MNAIRRSLMTVIVCTECAQILLGAMSARARQGSPEMVLFVQVIYFMTDLTVLFIMLDEIFSKFLFIVRTCRRNVMK